MNKTLLFVSIFGILLGIFFIGYGGYDDSPGLQFLGLISFIAGVVGVIKSRNRTL